MATRLTTRCRALSLAIITWLLAVATASRQAEAVLYDPRVEGGSRSGPWISSRLPAHVHRKIETAVAAAIDRLAAHPKCSRLFATLGENGARVLRRALYYPANVLMERRVCVTSYAFTKVGIRPTWICRRMWQLPVTSIELILLHEALHHAGLEEWPQNRAASDSKEISHQVANACGF